MSEHAHDHGHGGHGPEIHQEEDKVNFKALGIITAAVLVALGLGVVWAWRILLNTEGDVERMAEMTRRRIRRENQMGIAIDQSMINAHDPGPQLRVRQRRHLESWGWTDRAQGLAHVPIEAAMERMAREQGQRAPQAQPAAPAPSPAPSPAAPPEPAPTTAPTTAPAPTAGGHP